MTLDRVLILNDKFDAFTIPPTGKVYLAYKDGAIKFVNETGVTQTLATGVSPEDVQDIIGSFFADSATINVTYNDPANTFTAEVDLGVIDHTQIANIGVNDHATIDLHLANSGNPHFTTAAQVGADPAGSAVAAQAAAIQRANHTGSQLASTISDFASAVLGNLLTGLTAGTNVAIAATDTVQGAFAKLQAQITALSAIVSGQIIGDNFEEFLDNTAFATTSLTNVAAATFTTTSKPAGKYRIQWKVGWTASTITVGSIFGLYVDGVLCDREFRIENNDLANSPVFTEFCYATFATTTTHTIELRVRNSAAQTCTVNPVRVEIWRVV